MFSDCDSEAVGFKSCWHKEKTSKEIDIQTEKVSYQDNDSQSVAHLDNEAQTEVCNAESFEQSEESVQRLAEFLKRICPKVLEELDKIHNSQAFNSYNVTDDSEDNETKMLHTLDPNIKYDDEIKVSCIAWSCTGGVVAFGQSFVDHESWCDHQTKVFLYNINRMDYSSETKISKQLETNSCVTCLAAHPTEPYILTAGTYSGEIIIWNLQREGDSSLAKSDSISGGHKDPVTQISWIPDPDPTHKNYLLSSSSFDGRIFLWNLNISSGNLSVKERYIFMLDHGLLDPIKPRTPVGGSNVCLELGITCFNFSAIDNSIFVVGMEGGGIQLCSTLINKPAAFSSDTPFKDPVLKSFTKHHGAVTSIKIPTHNKDMFVTCGTDQEIHIYNMQESAPLQRIHFSWMPLGLQWCSIRNLLLVWGENGVAEYYNLSIGKPLLHLNFNSSKRVASFSAAQINPASFHVIAVGDSEGVVKIWKMPKNIKDTELNVL